MVTRAWPFMLAASATLILTGCAGKTLPPAKANVAGQWRGTWTFEAPPPKLPSTTLPADLTQSGDKVKGTMTVPGSSRTVPVTGTVFGDELRLEGEAATGWLMLRGDTLSGRVYGVFPGTGRLYGVYPETESLTRVK